GAAAGALTTLAAFGLGGKIIFGFASERITARLSFIVSLVIQATGLLLFIVAGGSGMVWVAVVVFGIGFGGMGALNALIVAEAFGLRAFGSIMGMVSMAGIFPHLAGPIVAGVLFDATGDYTLAFAIIVGLYLAGAIALLTARSTPLPTPESDAEATA
ncbi:MAG: MFS transporter, partial [Chloroflexi bacterium]|nr:MFS transporter [Chloroflexota bacterium]